MSGNTKNSTARFLEDWNDFVYQRVDIADFEMMTDERHQRHDTYRGALAREECLYSKLRGILNSDEQRKDLDAYKGAMESSALCSIDTAYEQGLKDAFMLIRKFIL